MLTTGFLIQGVIAAGTLANHFQQIEKPKKIVGATAEQVAIIEAAIADLINRIKTRKECARLLGGQQKALKALRESTISVEPLTAQVVIPESGPFAGKVLYEKILAGETSGKTIKLGSNTTMAPGGKISAINVATGKIVELQGVPADINEISETLGHELSHRTKSKKIIQDDNDPAQSAENDARVRKACGYH